MCGAFQGQCGRGSGQPMGLGCQALCLSVHPTLMSLVRQGLWERAADREVEHAALGPFPTPVQACVCVCVVYVWCVCLYVCMWGVCMSHARTHTPLRPGLL